MTTLKNIINIYGSRFFSQWRYLLVALTAIFVVPSLLLNVFQSGYPYIGPDAALFQYVGWYSTQGGLPYRHIWDSKPPLIHGVATVLGYLSFGNMVVLHVASMTLMAITLTASVYLIGQLVFDLTENHVAAFLSGSTVFTYPIFYILPSFGLRPKFFVILFGLLSLSLNIRNRYVLSGGFAAIAAGFWQGGVVFPCLVIGGIATKREWSILAKTLVGMAGVALVVLFPFILKGITNELIAQVILSPFVASEPLRLLWRMMTVMSFLKLALPVVVIGCIGILLAYPFYQAWWVPVGAGLFVLQVFLIDLDGPPDLMPVFIFVAVGVGLVYDKLPFQWPTVGFGGIALIAIGMVLIGNPFAEVTSPIQNGLTPGTVEWHYWNKLSPTSCHLRRSGAELSFLQKVGGSINERLCGPYNLGEIIKKI